jgi:hypothetical protein
MVANGESAMIRQVVGMRHLIGFLGERSQCGWWPTAYYEASSSLFLEPVFSNSLALARYHGVVEAARRLHDEHLHAGSYHLFRLPEEIEQDLHQMVRMRSGDLFAIELTCTRDSALDALNNSAVGNAQETVGPVLLGKIEDLRTTAILDSMTKIYHAAFSCETQAFPYLVK